MPRLRILLPYLASALLLAGLFYGLHELVWSHGWRVIQRNTAPTRHGIRAEVMPATGSLLSVATTYHWETGVARLKPYQGSAWAFSVLRVEQAGKYRFQVKGQGRGSARLNLGRYECLIPDLASGQAQTFELELPDAAQLLVIELKNRGADSRLRISMAPPGQKEFGLLQGELLGYPDLPNIEMYWGLIRLTGSPFVFGLCLALLWLALFTLSRGWHRRLPGLLLGLLRLIRTNRTAARVLVYSLIFITLQIGFGHLRHLFGDEGSYLITAMSITRDGDLNLLNNYERHDYLHFGERGFGPQVLIKNGVVPPEHGFGFPLLLALPFEALGIVGVRLALILIALAGAVLAAGLCDLWNGTPRTGDAAGLLVCFSSTWVMHAGRIMPEVTAGFLLILAFYLITRLGRAERFSRSRGLLAGALIAAFPLLYLKYTLLGLAAGLYALCTKRLRSNWAFYTGLLTVLGLFIIIWLLVYGSGFGVGSGGNSQDFSFNGALDRFWRPWLDRDHGLAVLQPGFMLFWLALPPLVWQGLRSASCWRVCAPLACLAYAAMYGLFIPSPGDSWPGRFLCALIPLMAALISLWAFSPGAQRWRRLAVWTGGGAGAWFALVMAFTENPSNQAAPARYLELFQPYWAQDISRVSWLGLNPFWWFLGLALGVILLEGLFKAGKGQKA
jgi:hypothetical protein